MYAYFQSLSQGRHLLYLWANNSGTISCKSTLLAFWKLDISQYLMKALQLKRHLISSPAHSLTP